MPKEDTQWGKGESGNPKGRPPKNRELESLIQKALENVGDDSKTGNRAIDRLVWIVDNSAPKQSIAAAKLILAYGYGAPKQQVALTHEIPTHEEWRDKIESWKRLKPKASQPKRKRKPSTGKR